LTHADVTPRAAFLNRRQVMAGLAGVGLAGMARGVAAQEALEPNTWEEITSYNNYYEFGTRKDDPAKYAHKLVTEPWSVKIDGLVDRPGEYDFKDIMSEMTRSRIRHLPVVEDGKLCGLISIGDVVKNRLEELETETSVLRDFIVGRS